MKKLLFIFFIIPIYTISQPIIKYQTIETGFAAHIVIEAKVMSEYETGEIKDKYLEFTAQEDQEGIIKSCISKLDYNQIEIFINVLKQFQLVLASGIDKGTYLEYIANDELELYLSETLKGNNNFVGIVLIDELDMVDRVKIIDRVLKEKEIQEMIDIIVKAKMKLDSLE